MKNGRKTCGPSYLTTPNIPQKFIDEGFDPKRTDLVIFLYLYNNTNFTSPTAGGGPCQLSRRPTYGSLSINIHKFTINMSKLGEYHYRVHFLVLC